MIPNGDTIYVFQNEDITVPGEGVGPAALLNLSNKDLWSKRHTSILGRKYPSHYRMENPP